MAMTPSARLAALYSELERAVPLPLASKPEDIVPGEGSATAQVLFIGEAPGYHESVQRRPFVGLSGRFLRKTILEEGLQPEQYYISNIVKARPPDNRDPSPEEIAAYKPFVDREIELINPALIATLGRFSMGKFLPDVRISQVHGRLHRLKWNGELRYVMPMFHPAAALRSGSMRQQFEADMKKLPKVLEWIEQQAETRQQTELVKEMLI
jgi:uracil-DNA glycosylase